jgi:DNA-binding PadR family transcriptional regulator
MLTAMPQDKTPQRSALGLIVLYQLFQGPQHVYAMQRLFEQTGKDRVVNVRSRASLYQTIERLQRYGLVEVVGTERTDAHPERILYGITAAGREVATAWLREMLSTTGGEYPEFIAAISMVFGLEPEDARRQLELRAEKLAAELADAESQLESNPGLPRLFLLEEEYRRAILSAELAWLRELIADLRGGRLTWSEQWLRQIAEALLPALDEPRQENRNDTDD